MGRSSVLTIITLMCLLLVVDSVCGETIWSSNKFYEVVEPRVEYATAESYCEAKGGHLAKLSLTILKAGELLYQFFYNAPFSTNCAWIGMTDGDKEGDWRWFDGTPVVDVTWEEVNAVSWFLQKGYWDCGTLCRGSVGNDQFRWEWQQTACNINFPFVCEYDGPEPVTVTTVGLFSAKRKPKAGVGVSVTVQKSKGYISGQSLAHVRCSMVTMCSRACEKKKDCSFFNYNNVTKHCRLFSLVENRLVEADDMWTIWALIHRRR